LAYLDVVVAAGGHDLRCLRLEPDDRRLTRGQRLSMSCAVNPAGSFAGSPWNGSVLLSTATGNIFLAHMPTRETEPLVVREGRLDPELLARRDAIIAQVRMEGIAISKGHLFRGFSAIAAPIFDHTEALAGSVTLLGLGSQIDRSPTGPVAAQVRQTARDLSQQLGSPHR